MLIVAGHFDVDSARSDELQQYEIADVGPVGS